MKDLKQNNKIIDILVLGFRLFEGQIMGHNATVLYLVIHNDGNLMYRCLLEPKGTICEKSCIDLIIRNVGYPNTEL